MANIAYKFIRVPCIYTPSDMYSVTLTRPPGAGGRGESRCSGEPPQVNNEFFCGFFQQTAVFWIRIMRYGIEFTNN